MKNNTINQADHQPDLFPVGTRIKFKRTLTSDANEESPGYTYARKGDLGRITGHGCWEGYWCKWDKWPNAFGIEEKDFEVVKE